MSLTGETLCPYCARFVDNLAARLYEDGVMNMTNFRYIPYGNAKETKASIAPCQWLSCAVTSCISVCCSQDGVQCQHGPRECELNRVLSCAIHLNPDQHVWFPFAKCLESRALSKAHSIEPVEPCAADAGIDFRAVHECASGTQLGCPYFEDAGLCQTGTDAYMHTTCLSEDHLQRLGVMVFEVVDVGYAGALGDNLQKQAADETGSLRPPHSYVPWITLNGVALGGAFEHLQIFICAAYLGDRYDGALLAGAPGLGIYCIGQHMFLA